MNRMTRHTRLLHSGLSAQKIKIETPTCDATSIVHIVAYHTHDYCALVAGVLLALRTTVIVEKLNAQCITQCLSGYREGTQTFVGVHITRIAPPRSRAIC